MFCPPKKFRGLFLSLVFSYFWTARPKKKKKKKKKRQCTSQRVAVGTAGGKMCIDIEGLIAVDEKVGRRSDGPVETSEASVAAETAQRLSGPTEER